MLFKFPANDLDLPGKLLSVIGSFWSDTYSGSGLVSSMLDARAALAKQSHLTCMELIAALSRFKLPVFHRENWSVLTLKASEGTVNVTPLYDAPPDWTPLDSQPLDQAPNDSPKYLLYDGAAVYGQTFPGPYHQWPIPKNLARGLVLLNRISDASMTLTAGVDFFYNGDTILFANDPFQSDFTIKRSIFSGGEVVDQEIDLWLYGGLYDWDTVYRQLGYALGQKLTSSQAYKDFLNAIMDAIVEGTTARSVNAALSAICDVSLTREPVETVQQVVSDSRKLWVITDQHAYGYSLNANAIVQAGDVVNAGDPLTDALTFYEFGRGQVPTVDQLRALVVSPGFLANGFYQELVFENLDVPLVVSQDDAGRTVVEFAVSGWPGDVQKFWDDVNAAGVASGRTLARCLDKRGPNAPTEPTAFNLPATINPMAFLLQNVFRDALTIVVARPAAFGPEALGLHHARTLRKIIPPSTAVILAAQLEISDDAITLDGSAGPADPNYTESAQTFLGESAAESIDPTVSVTETVHARQVQGRCE